MISRECLGCLGIATLTGGSVGLSFGVPSLILNGMSVVAVASIGLGASSLLTSIFIGVVYCRGREPEEVELRQPLRDRVQEGQPDVRVNIVVNNYRLVQREGGQEEGAVPEHRVLVEGKSGEQIEGA